ncbi:unnamed protein product [Parnassius apollo]|uniref:(apollo) hypothetical protein n=1 Tax=Parnassius apollo TaxID=110799 RepID=A0A8S3XUB4_PARAO|nr:unnamed protein product [Parnassius apollo]
MVSSAPSAEKAMAPTAAGCVGREEQHIARYTYMVSSAPSAEKAMAPTAAGCVGRRNSSGTPAQRARSASGSVPRGHSAHAVSDTGDRICNDHRQHHTVLKNINKTKYH